MIANTISKGKKVLVICQKRAALDVVFHRLDRAGLGKYIALIHDYNSDRSALYNNLSSVLETKTNTVNYSSDVNKLFYISKEIDQIVKEQNNIVSSMGKEYFGGVSLRKLYVEAQKDYINKLNLSPYLSKFEYNSISQITYKIGTFEQGCKRFDSSLHPWIRRKDFTNLGLDERSTIDSLIIKIIESLEDKATLICQNKSEQKQLVDSLVILDTQKGFFKRFKSDWVKSKSLVQKILKNDRLPENLEELRVMSEKGLTLWDLIMKYSDYLNNVAIDEISNYLVTGNFDTLRKIFLEMRMTLSEFEEIKAHDSKKMELSPDLREILNQCSNNLKNESSWDKIVEQEFYHHWIRYIEKEHPVLEKFPFETYLQNRIRLSELLREQRKLNVTNLIYKIENDIIRPVKATGRKRRTGLYAVDLQLWSKIADDLNKKRRVLPARKMIEKYQSIIFKLSPCWLASPEAVSSIFPLQKNLFDLIIFDEASQSAVERSLPSLYRGRNIVILGDEKQLRPFDLFRIKSSDEEDYDEDLVDDSMLSESLLVLSKRIYGYRYLNWHYRSKHQELIDFSNYAFYDGNLQVAPNTVKSPLDPPIRWIQTEQGIWSDRKNIPEALLVVNKLGKILTRNNQIERKMSVGIITFNDSQRDLILDEIENKRRLDPEFDELYGEAENSEINSLDDIPFVKNIENVQGDERDIIIFSVGYAKDANGNLSTHFGSLNQEGGENRLNVAITRAREQVIIVCSFDPNELNIEGSKNAGPKRLKEYLKYAKFVSHNDNAQANSLLQPSTNYKLGEDKKDKLLFDSHLEEMIYNNLRNLNYNVDTQIGNSNYKIDLAVIHPDYPSKYILAIECDGNTFQCAKSARERDVMRQQFLESRGWTLERIWSRNWWRDSKKEINRIHSKIEELRNTPQLLSSVIDNTLSGIQSDTLQNSEIQTIVNDLVKKRESGRVEFKSSFRYDQKLKCPNPKVLEKVIAKTIAAFMNSEGGTLLIGIDDEGNILGLENDYSTLKNEKQDSDGFEIELRQSVEKYTEDKIVNENFKMNFHKVGEKEICEVIICPSTKPVIIYSEGKPEFFVRVGNSSRPYNWEDFYEYTRRRFGR